MGKLRDEGGFYRDFVSHNFPAFSWQAEKVGALATVTSTVSVSFAPELDRTRTAAASVVRYNLCLALRKRSAKTVAELDAEPRTCGGNLGFLLHVSHSSVANIDGAD